MPEQHHSGGCQCGAVAFEADLDIEACNICNCSRCRKMGFVMGFTPRSKFTLLRGEENLTEYLFNQKTIRHLFCRTCGVQCFAYGTSAAGPVVAINLNTLDGVDARALSPRAYDGASL